MRLTEFGYDNENINEFTIIKVSKIVRYTSNKNNYLKQLIKTTNKNN
jgi:hypothetical protein